MAMEEDFGWFLLFMTIGFGGGLGFGASLWRQKHSLKARFMSIEQYLYESEAQRKAIEQTLLKNMVILSDESYRFIFSLSNDKLRILSVVLRDMAEMSRKNYLEEEYPRNIKGLVLEFPQFSSTRFVYELKSLSDKQWLALAEAVAAIWLCRWNVVIGD